MPKEKPQSSFIKKLFSFLILVCVGLVSFYLSNEFIVPRVTEAIRDKKQDYSSEILEVSTNPSIQKQNQNRGLRTIKIPVDLDDVDKDKVSEVIYKDVQLISTSKHRLTDNEIALLKKVIDSMPQKLYDYRPWAIIATDLKTENFNSTNPEGVAYAKGPYVYVGDITFKKSDDYDTGSFRGLVKIMAHEFTHVAQFFEISNIPNNTEINILEDSSIVSDWIKNTGWNKLNEGWVLDEGEFTTDYGKSDPVEDMADSVGSLIIGDEYVLSESRINWTLNWLGISKEELYMGTLPLSKTIVQRSTESQDHKLLAKYQDSKALTQDLFNFQSEKAISIKDFSKFYTEEFQKRGWTGSINSKGAGEFIYKDNYKVNLEMDQNTLRVVTIVFSVY